MCPTVIYCRLGNFHVKNNLCKIFFVVLTYAVPFDLRKFLTIDGYNMDESQVSLAVAVDQTFTSGV